MFARERQSDRAPQGSSFTIRSWPLRASHLGGAGQELPRARVCNFEPTGEAGAGNCRTDGRVAQSAERVREQHETVVRNHSPAAIPLASDGNAPRRTAGAKMNQPGRCRD